MSGSEPGPGQTVGVEPLPVDGPPVGVGFNYDDLLVLRRAAMEGMAIPPDLVTAVQGGASYSGAAIALSQIKQRLRIGRQ